MTTNKTVLEAKNIKKTFSEGDLAVDVLKGIDFKVEAGEQIAIIGASGSGKSTLMHILGGLDTPSSGDVFLNGISLVNASDSSRCALRNRYMGFIYQFHHLLPEFSALENVAMPLLIRGEKTAVSRDSAEDILDKVGLKHRLKHKPGELSGGERQRVAIARALVTNPKCVLADEPTGNLDKKNEEEVYRIMLELNQTMQTSFIMVTHEMALAEKMDRIITIEDGFFKED
ncbi:MAG: lipoprotein-releasing ABC transporter ATP-binding protein LolD [Gammaproteobacteria bacterium]|nr:MAG: lipoprotein-releasing ABC transporter ATP-binding protein LolD [Gammaproteobacteria bacterium]